MAVRVIGRVHKSVAGSFEPRKITLVLYTTSHVVSLKVTVHPALHRRRIPMREAINRPGTKCLVRVTGRPGMFILHGCIDLTVSPLGRLIVRGTTVCFTCCIGVPAKVALVSAMAWVPTNDVLC